MADDDDKVTTVYVNTGNRRDWQYLGDGVYVEHDDCYLWLHTYNGLMKTNQIGLEPEVLARLIAYNERIRR
jgi:hypothetical protein